MSFGAGSAGFVNAGVYHMTRATDEGTGTVQLCHIFRPILLEDVGGRIAERCVRPLVEARGVELLSWDAGSPQDARALDLFRESFELRPVDGATYEMRLRALISEIWALAFEKARPLMGDGPAAHPTHRDLRFEKTRDFVHEHYARRSGLPTLPRRAVRARATASARLKATLAWGPPNTFASTE